VGCWRTKAAVSLKRVLIEEKLLWTAYRNSPTLFRTVPSPTPYHLPFLEIGGLRLSYPLLSQEQVKIRTSNLGDIFTWPFRIEAHYKVWAYPGAVQIFGYPLLSQEWVKLRTLNLASTFTVPIRIKAHKIFWRKGSVGVPRGCHNFLGTPYYLRNG